MRKFFVRLLYLSIFLYAGALAWTYFNQRSLLYFPQPGVLDVSEYQLEGVEDIRIPSGDLKLQMWYKEPENGMPIVLYLHGNSYHLGNHQHQFKEILNLGYGLAALAYRGFSRSEGLPSKEGILEDVSSAVEFLQSKGFDSKKILVVGESLGSGVAVESAIKHKFGGIFLITPYTSIAKRAQEIYWYFPANYLVRDNFISDENIHLIDAPVMMVHGTKDVVIPHAHCEKLFSLASEPKKMFIYEGKGHSNLDYRLIYTEMKGFFAPFFQSSSKLQIESGN